MRAVFIDRDGTITEEDGLFYRYEQIRINKNAAEAIKILNKSFLVIMITNQPVVARGLCSEDDVREINSRIAKELEKQGARIDGVYFCPHHPEQHADVPEHARKYRIACKCRKPRTGMIEKAAGDFKIDVGLSFFIGDGTIDMETAKNAGCVSVLVKTGLKGEDGKYPAEPNYVCKDILDAAKLIDSIKDISAVILAGGMGERLRPLTDKVPKPMLPIKGRPLLEHQISLLKRHGIRDVVICGHYLFRKIKEFGDGRKFGVRITYVDDGPAPLGSGGALKNAREYIKSENFVVLNGDVVTNINISRLVRFHMEKKSLATPVLRKTDHPLDSDIVEMDHNNMVTRFVGRGQDRIRTAITGVFMLNRAFLDIIPAGKSNLEKDGISKAIHIGKVYGFVSEDYFKDIGTIERYQKAEKEFEPVR